MGVEFAPFISVVIVSEGPNVYQHCHLAHYALLSPTTTQLQDWKLKHLLTMQQKDVFIKENSLLSKIQERTSLEVCGLNDFREAFRFNGMVALWNHRSSSESGPWDSGATRKSATRKSAHHDGTKNLPWPSLHFRVLVPVLDRAPRRVQANHFWCLSSLGRYQLRRSRPVHICTPVLDSCAAGSVLIAWRLHVPRHASPTWSW